MGSTFLFVSYLLAAVALSALQGATVALMREANTTLGRFGQGLWFTTVVVASLGLILPGLSRVVWKETRKLVGK